MTKIWAHRGASAYAPENTMAAFKLAVEMGADGIELDVRESRDGRLMVIHDETVDRTGNGSGRVADMSCQELKALDFSNGFEPYRGVRIPTLKEVYGFIRTTRLTVNVEVKSEGAEGAGMVDKLLALEKEMGMQGRVLYSSFNHYVLRDILRAEPDARTGLLYMEPLLDPWAYARYCKAKAIHPHYRILLEGPDLQAVMEGCREADIAVHAWTVNDAESMEKLAEAGVDAVITNVPDLARRVLG